MTPAKECIYSFHMFKHWSLLRLFTYQICLSTSFLLCPYTRNFRLKLVYWNESVYCTLIDKAFNNSKTGRAAFCDQPLLSYESFSRISCAVFGQNRYANIRRLWTIFPHKKGFLAFKKYKNIVFSTMAVERIFN